MKKRIYFLCFILLSAIILAGCNKKQEYAMYKGADISKKAKITRDKVTKAANLEISSDGKWKLYAGNNVDNIDFSEPIFEGKESGIFPLNVNDTARSYFQLITKEGRTILAEEHLPMTGGYNFRDLGGIRTSEGRYIKWGKIFRSDELTNLTEADLKYLSAIPVSAVVDFRSQVEVNKSPDKLFDNTKYYHLSIEPGNLLNQNTDLDFNNTDFSNIMLDINRMLVTDSTCIAQYKNFFKLIQNEENVPIMFHCSAGKDRTGMAAALILYALGVDDQTVMENYLLSNQYLGDKYSSYIEQYPALEVLMTVKAEYLQAGIDQIKKDYGTVEIYLANVLSVNIQKMKDTFLY